jgi:hypothetical protein
MSVRRTGVVLIVASLLGTVVVPATARVTQGQLESVVIDDPRPLAAAVLELEQRCHCAISYEDSQWTESEVEEVRSAPAQSPGTLRPKVPKGRSLSVTLDRQIDAASPNEMQAALNAMFDAFERAGNPGAFRVVSSQMGYHVVPKEQALFDVRITVATRSRSVADAIPEILAAVSTASGKQIRLGRVPVKLLMGTTTDAGANNQRFGDVLARILASTGKPLSWRLLYDFAMASYYLNLHTVQ